MTTKLFRASEQERFHGCRVGYEVQVVDTGRIVGQVAQYLPSFAQSTKGGRSSRTGWRWVATTDGWHGRQGESASRADAVTALVQAVR